MCDIGNNIKFLTSSTYGNLQLYLFTVNIQTVGSEYLNMSCFLKITYILRVNKTAKNVMLQR